MKQSAKETGDATRPVQVCFGKVTSTSPLKIQIDQKITLGKAQLVQTRTVYNALKVGEEVVLLRQQGGQKYIVLDKVVTT
jgi:hypothetical protein